MSIQFAAPCLFGLEAPLAEELRSFGAENVNAEHGRVLFSGDENMIARANIRSRYAERIMIVVGSFEAHTFDQLFEHTKLYRWDRWIGKDDAFPVKGHSLNSDLHSVSDCQSIIKKAVVESLKRTYKTSWFEETGVTYQITFSIMKNRVTLMLDTTGTGLHKRGYRPAVNAAPIKETLAAAMCSFARLRGYHTLYDPMCGSGTIAIEGALLANNIAPGKARNFAAEKWRQTPRKIWLNERDAAIADERVSDEFRCFASDIDRRSLDLASGNARRAGMDRFITFSQADIRDFKPQTEKGTLIVNPPYGERLADEKTARELSRVMGRLFERRPGWSYSIITADEDFEREFGRKADKRRKLYNGMIKCQLYMYYK